MSLGLPALDLQLEAKKQELHKTSSRLKIFELRLGTYLTHKDLKEVILSLIPEKEKTATLARIYSGTIDEKKALLEIINNYDRELKEKAVIEEQIEKDRQNFREIMQKFLDLQKTVNEYQIGEDKIIDLR